MNLTCKDCCAYDEECVGKCSLIRRQPEDGDEICGFFVGQEWVAEEKDNNIVIRKTEG